MTVGAMSQCEACSNFRPPQNWGDPITCDAFPDGIPDEVYDNLLDHRQPVPGDNGIRFEAEAGAEFPAYAFA